MTTIISNKNKFIFIHINKAGGTSVSSVLEKSYEWAGIKKIYTSFERRFIPSQYKNFSIFGQHFCANHASALMVRNTIGQQKFDEYLKFCIVRNPWEREVSRYFYARKAKNHQAHEMANRLDFSDYIKWRGEDAIKRGVRGYQFKKISDQDGNVMVNHIVHLENLDEEILPVLEKIGIDYPAKIPQLNATTHKPYQSLYDEESVELVRYFTRDDIDHLGYVF